MNNFKRFIKSAIHSVGFDLQHLNPESNPSLQLLKGLERFKIDLVLDIGANVGQFASDLRSVGYRGDLVSFEPLSAAHQALTRTALRDSNWRIHPRCAIGAQDGEIEIHIAGNSVSSSLLPMMEAHSAAAAHSAYVGVETTPISKLDSVVPLYLEVSRRALLKIDTQGYEWQVLDGARETLSNMQGVLCELSLVPLYEGQRMWVDVIQRLESEGFALWAIQPGFIDPRDGRTLQVDAILFRV